MDKFAIHHAAEHGDLDAVRKLVEEGVSVDSRDDQGRTPLHLAAERGRREVAQLLISSKCDLNPEDRRGSTPLLASAYSQRREVTDLLLRHGARVDTADEVRFTLLHSAALNGWADLVQHILDKGLEVADAATHWGDTPLMLAGRAEKADVLEILLRAGADANRRDDGQRTVLHWAAFNGDARTVQLLLKREGLDLNPQEEEGQTPLHWGCDSGNHEVLRLILEAGADCTIKDNERETALSNGIRRNELNLEGIRLFVQHGAFLEEFDYDNIFQNLSLRESVLKDASLCTQSVVNKFHHQSLPALKSIRRFADRLPNIDNFILNARQIDEVQKLIECEIEKNTFCNVVRVHPTSLSALCILTLITY